MKRDLELEAIVAAGIEDGIPADPTALSDSSGPRIGQFRKLASSLKIRHYDAPADAVATAHRLMPGRERRQVWARLVSGSLSLAGARAAAADNFQMVFEAEGARTRLMYVRQSGRWEVTGQAPAGWGVERGGKPIPVEAGGRFFFHVRRLDQSGLKLVENDLEILIPPADQAENDESRRPD